MKKTFLFFAAIVGVLFITEMAQATNVGPITFAPGDYDNTANTATNNQTSGLFRDVFWDNPTVSGYQDAIHAGKNLTGAHPYTEDGLYDSLNFKGQAGADGGTWLTIYDSTVNDGTVTRDLFDAFNSTIRMEMDVRFVEFANMKAVGPMALFNEGHKGLALVLVDNGNSDLAKMELVWKNNDDAQPPTPQASIGIDSSIAEGSWYRIVMDLMITGPDSASVTGWAYKHQDQSNPNSALDGLIGTLNWNGLLSTNDLTNPGEIGIMATCTDITASDNTGISVTNFSATPEPATLLLLGLGGLLLRRK